MHWYTLIPSGNLLLDLIDKGPDMEGQLTCQLMLRYGFIEPLLEGK